MAERMDDVLDYIRGLDTQNLKYEIDNYRKIKAWAQNAAGIDWEVGSKVVVCDDFAAEMESSSGWHPYRECMVKGATATVHSIDFNGYHDYWYSEVSFDREWSVSDYPGGSQTRYWHGPVDETPDGFTPPSPYEQETYPAGRKHRFMMPVKHLRRID